MAEDGGSYWISALAGFIFMLFISPFFPVAGPIVGRSSAVPRAPGGGQGRSRRAPGRGFIVAAIFSVVAVVGTAILGAIGTFIGLGIAAFLFALALYFGVLGAIGGAVGGALKAWMISRRRVTG